MRRPTNSAATVAVVTASALVLTVSAGAQDAGEGASTASTVQAVTATAGARAGAAMAERALDPRALSQQRLFNATIDQPPEQAGLAKGRLVAMGGSARGGAAMACFSCHGAKGAGDGAGVVPRLAGMPAWYLYKQLEDYASGRRSNPVMSGIAAMLSHAEREHVSEYYALLSAPYPQGTGLVADESLQWGQRLAAIGSAGRAVPACVNCHGPQGGGLAPSVPPLAGQYAEYLALQLQHFRSGERNNDAAAVMRAVASKMTDEDIRAVSRYYERVRPDEGARPSMASMVRAAADGGASGALSTLPGQAGKSTLPGQTGSGAGAGGEARGGNGQQ